MNIIKDNEILRNIEINSIHLYGNNATNLIKENSILRQFISFYKDNIEFSKIKFMNYFQTDKNLLKEILIFDLKKYNKKLMELNNENKNEKNKLEIKIKKLDEKLLSNINKLNEEKEKLKEDNFILLNENKQKDSIISILNKEKVHFIGLEFLQELKRTNFEIDNISSLKILKNELKKTQKKLSSKTKKHNDQLKKGNELLNTKNDLKDQIKTNRKNRKSKFSPVNRCKSNNIFTKSSNYQLVKKKSKDDIFENNNVIFADFEDDLYDEMDDINFITLNTEVNNIKINLEDKILLSEENNLKTERNEKNIFTLIPKLNLKQIEYNNNNNDNNFNNCYHKRKFKSMINFEIKNNVDEKIEDLKKEISKMKQKNKRLKEIIKNFKEYYDDFNHNLTSVNKQFFTEENYRTFKTIE